MPDAEGLWITIPVKPFAEGKSRIAMAGADRVALNRRFLAHALEVAVRTVPPARVIVVSRDEAALAMARAADARALRETRAGLNEALAQAAHFVAARGGRGIASLFTDLPFSEPADLAAMIAAFRDDTLVIAPDERGSGSNALLMAPGALAYRHGVNSFWRHVAAAAEAGMSVAIVSRPGLRRDVDRAADLAALEARTARPALHPQH